MRRPKQRRSERKRAAATSQKDKVVDRYAHLHQLRMELVHKLSLSVEQQLCTGCFTMQTYCV